MKLTIIITVCILCFLFGVELEEHNIAKQCQSKTYFTVGKIKFECMEWKNDPSK